MSKWLCMMACLLAGRLGAADGTIQTVAGAAAVDGVSATASLLNFARGVVSDGVGNIYVADSNNHRIRRIDAGTKIITTIAGTGVPGYSGDYGPATLARLNHPMDLCYTTTHGFPSIIFTDVYNNRVREINLQTGEIQTLAGNGVQGYGGDGGLAIYASANLPHGVTVDDSGNIYFSDTYNHRVRRIDWATRAITTVAGTGAASYSNVTYSARLADLYYPVGLKYRGGYVYFCDQQNSRIRRMYGYEPWSLSIVAGTGSPSYGGDGGSPIAASFYYPRQLSFDASGNMVVVDHYSHAIRRINAAFTSVTTVAGSPNNPGYAGDGGPALSANLNTPENLALAPDGDILIADGSNNCIRRVDSATQLISTYAGSGVQDNVPGTQVVLRDPKSPRQGPGQSVVFAEPSAYRLRKLDLGSGIITTFAGKGSQGLSGDGGPAEQATFWGPKDIARDGSGNYYVPDNYYYSYPYIWFCGFPFFICFDYVTVGWSYLRKIDSAGNITTVAGTAELNNTGNNGPAFNAKLGNIQAAVVSGSNLFLADSYFHVIRRINLSNMNIYHYAGVSGSAGYSGDNGQAATATFNNPQGLAVDSQGNLYVADTYNNAVRRIDAQSLSITTICGLGPTYGGYAGDGGAAAAAALFYPVDLYFDPQDNLYIADSNNDRIRRIDAGTGQISTVVGSGFRGFSGDGGPALLATMSGPKGVMLGAGGDIYVADTGNARLRKISFAQSPTATPVANGPGKAVAYPSPAKNNICFSYQSAGAGKASIEVYNIAFERVATIEDNVSAGDAKTCVDISGLATGAYLYKVNAPGSSIKLAKFKVVK